MTELKSNPSSSICFPFSSPPLLVTHVLSSLHFFHPPLPPLRAHAALPSATCHLTLLLLFIGPCGQGVATLTSDRVVFGPGFETVQYDDPLAPVSPQGVCYHSSDLSLCFGSNTDSGLSEPPCGSNLFISLMHVASVEVPLFTGYLHCCCTLK